VGNNLRSKELEGLGGWLILVGIGIVLSPLLVFGQGVQNYSNFFSAGSWEALTTPGTQAYNPLWAPIIIGEIGINCSIFIAWLFIAYYFFTRSEHFPKWYIGILIFTPSFLLSDALAIKFVLPNEPVFDPATLKDLGRSFMAALIWIPYMLMSKRVKVTFVNQSDSFLDEGQSPLKEAPNRGHYQRQELTNNIKSTDALRSTLNSNTEGEGLNHRRSMSSSNSSSDTAKALKLKTQAKESPIESVVKNIPTQNINVATKDDVNWTEEFTILNEYDLAVAECHDELARLDHNLSSQFREEVVSNRKNATKIKDRLKAEYEKILNPYTSESLNEALAKVRLLGTKAEEEFNRVVEVMGEDIEVEKVFQNLKKKYGVLLLPEDRGSKLLYWGIVENGDRYSLGKFQYDKLEDAIAYAQKKLNAFLQHANSDDFKRILTANGYHLERINHTNYRISSKDGSAENILVEQLPKFIKNKFEPNEIYQYFNYLEWTF
jgi:hypothetical protein